MIKNKYIELMIGIAILGLSLIVIGLFIFLSSEKNTDPKIIKTEPVEILGKEIKLPCKINELESILDTKVIESETDLIKYAIISM